MNSRGPQNKDGTVPDTDDTNTGLALLNSGEHRALTTSPREYARMIRTLIGNLDGMVYRCRSDGRWTMEFVSEGCQRLTGYPASDLLRSRRRAYADLIFTDDLPKLREVVKHAIATGERYSVEYRIRHADGEPRWVWERGIAIFTGPDAPVVFEGFIEDITDRKRAEQALAEAEHRYHSIFEQSLEGIFRTTPDGRYEVANPALARIYGYDSPEDLVAAVENISQQLYVNPGRREEFRRLIETEGAVTGFEYESYRRNREVMWVSVNARAVRDTDGRVTHYEGTLEDVTERKRYQERIEQQANFDALTGLANRTLLADRLRQAVAIAERGSASVAVAFVDLDQFKFINDSFGHQMGDALLQAKAERLKACLRETDTVARQGGDEFVLLLRDYATADDLTRIVQRVHAAMGEPWVAGRREFHVTCSIGVSVYPQDGRTADMLLRNADSAMYKAKENGRNNFQFFTAELNRLMVERLSIEHKLRGALTRKQFLLHYQPRIDMRTGGIVGAEALLRWQVPQGELFSPARFISVAEDTGLIVPIGKWALMAACEQNKAWQEQGLSPIVVSVNVSQRQFWRDDIVRTVADVLERTGLAPRYLQLELTESLVMNDAEKFVGMLRDLKNLGVQLAVDDFGTGYSSLSYLKRFPVDHLKVDRSFVKDLVEDPDDATIVQAIIALGHKLGLKIVAEGVENEQQFDYLRSNGCDEMQGFHFCRPVAAHDLAAMLLDQSSGRYQRLNETQAG
jgi:diguanylate cyclase (GGDEF)-like protein/PAS domain S-box-containing protein